MAETPVIESRLHPSQFGDSISRSPRDKDLGLNISGSKSVIGVGWTYPGGAEGLRVAVGWARPERKSGPCPACGGEDRCVVQDHPDGATNHVTVSCRQDCGRPALRAALRALTPGDFVESLQPPPAAADEKRRRREAEKERAGARAAKEAAALLASCKPGRSEYLARKGLDPPIGMIAPPKSIAPGALVLPMRRDGQIVAVQTVTDAGVKKFRPYGCSVKRASFLYGADNPDGIRWLVEGWATGQAVLQALGRARRTRDSVRVCFSAAGVAACAGTASREAVIADHDWWKCNGCKARWTEAATEQTMKAATCSECGSDQVATPAGARYAVATGLPWWQPPKPGTDACDLWIADPRQLTTALRRLVRGVIQRGR